MASSVYATPGPSPSSRQAWSPPACHRHQPGPPEAEGDEAVHGPSVSQMTDGESAAQQTSVELSAILIAGTGTRRPGEAISSRSKELKESI